MLGFFNLKKMHQVYILHSQKLNRFYIGFTSNLEQRLVFHKNPENRKFTYNVSDWILFFTIDCNSKKHGLQIEKHIKSMKSKVYIENLVKYPEMVEKLKNKFQSDC